MLLAKTSVRYYVVREAMVTNGGNQLRPLGGRIVARAADADSFVS